MTCERLLFFAKAKCRYRKAHPRLTLLCQVNAFFLSRVLLFDAALLQLGARTEADRLFWCETGVQSIKEQRREEWGKKSVWHATESVKKEQY